MFLFLSLYSLFFLYPTFPRFPHTSLPLALPLSVLHFLPIFLPNRCSFLLSPFPLFPHLPVSPCLSFRSWRSVSAIITMQSCSLSERLTARASRHSNSSQSKSCKRSALSWRTRAKPCWVSSFVCVYAYVCVWWSGSGRRQSKRSSSRDFLADFLPLKKPRYHGVCSFKKITAVKKAERLYLFLARKMGC